MCYKRWLIPRVMKWTTMEGQATITKCKSLEMGLKRERANL